MRQAEIWAYANYAGLGPKYFCLLKVNGEKWRTSAPTTVSTDNADAAHHTWISRRDSLSLQRPLAKAAILGAIRLVNFLTTALNSEITMGNLAGLDLAAGILAVVGHHADLLSASAMPENGSSLNGKNEAYIFEKFRQSALGLSRHNSYVPRKPSTNASWMSRDELALRELASEYLEDCRLLLEEGESVERSLPREQGSQPRRNSTTSSAAFMLKGRHSMERIEQLVNEVTNYTRSIIRCV